MKKEIGIIGLGKMGGNCALRLREKGWRVVVYNRTAAITRTFEKKGFVGTYSLREFVGTVPAPRTILLVLPAGDAVEHMLFGTEGLIGMLFKGDTVIDGGNSLYTDSQRRALRLKKRGIHFVDLGISGGPNGARNGACLMIGGEKSHYNRLQPLFKALAREDGAYQFFPGAGAGHFAKMVHNGIEYGMMQAIAEGFEVLKKSKYHFDLSALAEIYNKGSVIESRLVGWLQSAFKAYGAHLPTVSSVVAHTGEGKWTIEAAKKLGVPVPVIADSLRFRIQSKRRASFAGKVLSALRGQFGGHATIGR